MKLEWTEPAEMDLGDIYAYIARDIPIYAEQLIDQIIETVFLLEDHPLIGRKVPEAEREDVRELIFQNYRIIYLARADCIYILSVIHGSRDLTQLKQMPWEII